MRARARRIGDERGAVAVEFALVMLPLFLILFGVFEFGKAWSEYQVFQGAAREGARCAAVRGGQADNGLPVCDIRARVVAAAEPYEPAFGTGSPSVTVEGAAAPGGCTDADALAGKNVTVSWEQPFHINIPFWKNVTATSTISGVFRCE